MNPATRRRLIDAGEAGSIPAISVYLADLAKELGMPPDSYEDDIMVQARVAQEIKESK